MHLKRIVAKLATASLLAGTAAIAGTGTASASTTNGEHIAVVAPLGSPYTSAILIGTDYQGNHIQSPHIALRGGKVIGGKIYPNDGFYEDDWLKAFVQINWYTGNQTYNKTTYCFVPPSKSGNGTYWACGVDGSSFDAGF